MSQSQSAVTVLSERPSGRREPERATSSLESNYGRAKGLSVPDDSLHESNFNKFRWRYREFLLINDCRKEIKSWLVRECSTTLKSLELAGLNAMVNLKLILKHCVNLRNIVFSRIVWTDSKPDSSKHKQNSILKNNKMFVILNNLTALKFAGKGNLTPHEMLVLEYFFHQVRCPKLTTLSFDRSPSSESSVDVQSSLDDSDKKVDPLILSKFLLLNESTIKFLEVERSDIDLVADNLDNFKKLRITKLTCNVASPTSARTLEIQNNLKFLDCFTNATISENTSKAIALCIRTCSHSLREISFIQNIVHDDAVREPKTTESNETNEAEADNFPTVAEERIVHDCTAYRVCRRLKSLTIICVVNESMNTPYRCHGRILNMHKLPLSLSTLIIRFDMVDESDLNQFAKRFPRLVHLKYFVFQGNPECPFIVKLKWIQILIKLPNLLTFEFHSCEVEQGKAVKLFINSIPGLANKLRINSGSCIFRQAQTQR